MITPDQAPSLPGPAHVAALVAELQASSGDFAALLARYGQPAPALRHYGLIGWQRADLAVAVAAFRAALAITPDDADLWRDLAGALDGGGQAAAAESCVRRALHHRPADARAWLTLAQLRSRADDADEAVDGFRRALALDPTLGDAHFGLGLIAFSRKEIEDAMAHLRSAIANGHATALGHGSLAHVLHGAGRFADCADAFDTAAGFGELDATSKRQRARARAFATIIDGRLGQALADHVGETDAGYPDADALLADAFLALNGYGYRDAAIAVGRMRLARDPGDASQRYLLDAVEGRALARAPADYIESHFDGFAESFDRKMVDLLLYDVPRALARLVAAEGARFADGLDFGCGTGLAAAHLAPFGGRLTGVDLSGGMLKQAAKRGSYAELVKADAVDYLDTHPDAFDLVAAADALIYFGDLGPVFAAAARALRPGGLFAFSVETMAEGGHRLQPSGRFTHAIPHVERLAAAAGFAIVAQEATVLRIEAGRPARGQLLLLRREAASAAV